MSPLTQGAAAHPPLITVRALQCLLCRSTLVVENVSAVDHAVLSNNVTQRASRPFRAIVDAN